MDTPQGLDQQIAALVAALADFVQERGLYPVAIVAIAPHQYSPQNPLPTSQVLVMEGTSAGSHELSIRAAMWALREGRDTTLQYGAGVRVYMPGRRVVCAVGLAGVGSYREYRAEIEYAARKVGLSVQ